MKKMTGGTLPQLATNLFSFSTNSIYSGVIFNLLFQTRLGSEIRLRPPPQSARPPPRPPTTQRARSSRSLERSRSFWRKNTDCRSRSLQPLQISLVSNDPIKFISRMTIEILYWHIHHGRIVLKGAASPQAVKKLLSLSEQSRPKVEHSHPHHHHHYHDHRHNHHCHHHHLIS